MAMYWLLFLLLFGVVVFIHELGHFTVAKLCGVFVERFAIGFGPALIRKKWGETEYAICALPLGGYVKMRGEDPEEAKNAAPDPRSFAQIRPLKKMAIVAMGPTSNLILPIIVFTCLFMVGMPTLSSKIGSVLPDSPAEKTGLKPGDEVLALDGAEVWRWTDMEERLRLKPGQDVRLRIRRNGTEFETSVRPASEKDLSAFGEEVMVGKIGVSPVPYRPVVGISLPNGPAEKAGLKSGDIITKVNNRKIDHWWQFEEAFSAEKGAKTVTVERSNKETFEGRLKASVLSPKAAGIEEGELFIREVVPNSVAAEKGLKAGDRLTSLNGQQLKNWFAFQQMVRKNAGEKLSLTILRGGKPLVIDFVPKEISDRNSLTQEKEKRRQLGVVSASVPGEFSERTERYLNPFKAFYHAAQTTGSMIGMTIQGLAKLVTGKLALKKSLGGPISIFYLAGGSYETGGWIAFFRMMALLSVTLGIINYLPIPILDGGHLLFFAFEGIFRKPVSLRVREIAHQVGLVLIIGLMLITFYVDIERYFLDKIRGLFN